MKKALFILAVCAVAFSTGCGPDVSNVMTCTNSFGQTVYVDSSTPTVPPPVNVDVDVSIPTPVDAGVPSDAGPAPLDCTPGVGHGDKNHTHCR